jgi:Zn-finger nucleic acid-binding protein
MHCPVDHSVELVRISVEGIGIERCVKCNGHWLQHGELSKLAARDASVEPVASVRRNSNRFCPADTSPLTEVEFPQQSGLRLDVCPQCKGIWLDAHELGQALTVLGRNPQQTSPQTPSRPVLDLLVRLTSKRR